MADVRSMLRAEREARRITHPHASYTTSGNLLCNLCEVPVKSEKAWSSHLHTTQHSLRLSRARDAEGSRKNDSTSMGKKRKAVDLEASPIADRKKVKPEAVQAVEEDEAVGVSGGREDTRAIPDASTNTAQARNVKPQGEDGVDEAALQALENELEALQRENDAEEDAETRATAYSANVTISAPAMTAEQVAAQAREEQSAQKGKRDTEIEEEREDAARILQDEFEEMEGLEERAKKLRERREALRRMQATPQTDTNLVRNDVGAGGVKDGGVQDNEDEDNEDDDHDDIDDWFGAS